MTSVAPALMAPRSAAIVSARWTRTAALRVIVIGAVPVLIALMDWVHVHSLVGRYGEVQFPSYPNAHHALEYTIFSWTIGTLPALWLPLNARRPSQVLTWMFYLLVFVPTAVLTPHAYLRWQQGAEMLLLMLMGMMVLQLATLLPPLRLPSVRLTRTAFWLLIGLITVAAYAATVRSFGSIIRLVSLAEVYVQRGRWIESRGNLLTGYLMMWQAVVINPLLIAFGIVRKKVLPLLLGLGGQLALFSVAAQQHVLGLPLAMIGLYVLMGKTGRNFGLKALLGTSFAFSIPVLLGENASALVIVLVNLLLSRLFLNSGLLSVFYFEYFGRNPAVAFTEVKPISWMFHSPYIGSYKEALAWDFWGRYNDPNANIFADGFAQLGAAGVLIESVGLMIVFWLLDSVCRQRRYVTPFVALMLGSQVAAMTNGNIPNMILGGGMALLLVLLFLTPSFPELTDPRSAAAA